MKQVKRSDIQMFMTTYEYQDGDHTHTDDVEEEFVSLSLLRGVLADLLHPNTTCPDNLQGWVSVRKLKEAFEGVLK
jgi:hypothetical protein